MIRGFYLFFACCRVWALGLTALASFSPSVLHADSKAAIPLPSEKRWAGDLDGMQAHHQVRFLVVYNEMFYFLDGATQRGSTYELAKMFENQLNKQFKKKTIKIRAIFIPVARDELIPALLEGRGDIAAANLTITPERLKQVDFSDPFLSDVSEILVTGKLGPDIRTLDDLAGKSIHVRFSSSYYESLLRLNKRFLKEGKAPVKLIAADPLLEDSDLLEMANAGILPLLIVDKHKALFWGEIFPNIKVHEDIAVADGGSIAWAMRKNSPQLKKAINAFVKTHKKGTLHGNILFKRYLQNNKWVRNNLSDQELQKLNKVLDLFRKYGDKYDFDWLMVAALGYQESGLDQKKRSPSGAIGIMQLLPSTAKDPNVDIPNIKDLENNIHAGAKYLRFLYDRYFADEPMDELNKMLFSFAAYNAGPAKVRKLRAHAEKMGLDRNLWFRNVEVSAAKIIGRETVQYVANIYKYYTAYRLVMDDWARKQKVKKG
jgi:membrane-bound lytic murein transglycosylase MltF